MRTILSQVRGTGYSVGLARRTPHPVPRTRSGFYLLAAALLCALALGPLLHPYYFWGAHDARHSVYFLVEFERAIADGVLYPRWAPDFAFGYGYPIFNIYGPLSFYLAEGFRLLGFDFVAAVKIVFGLGLVLSALAMYLCAADLFGRRAALLASVLYVYAPYRLVDLYVRGALAEHVAFVFFPLILWAGRRAVLWSLRRGLRDRATHAYIIATALALAALVLTHNGIAILFLPVALLFWAWTALVHGRWTADGRPQSVHEGSGRALTLALSQRERGSPTVHRPPGTVYRPALALAAASVVALGAAAIFWLPLVTEYGAVRVDQWTTNDYDLRANFVYPHQLLSPLWGYGVSQPGPDDKLSFQVGLAPFGLALVAVGAAFWLKEKRRPVLRLSARRRADLGFFALLALAAALLMLPSALPVWQALPIANIIQFPWRLLTLTTLGLSLAGGVSGLLARGRPAGQVAFATFIGMAVLASYPYLGTPEEVFRPPAEGPVSLAGLMRFEQSSGELVGLTRWNTEKPTDSPLFYVYLEGKIPDDKVDRGALGPDATVTTTRHTTTLDEVQVHAPSGTPLRFFTQMYPGWTAYLDGRPVAITPSPRLGLVTVDVPPGEHTVRLAFEDTAPRRIGTILTLTTLAGLAGYGAYALARRRRTGGVQGP